MTESGPGTLRLAEAIDSVRWDYDPEDDQLSPLVSTERYFRDFPWEPEDVFTTPETAPGEPRQITRDPAESRDRTLG